MKLFELSKGYFDDSKKMAWVNKMVGKLSTAMDSAFKSGQLVLPPDPNQKSAGEPEPKTGVKPGQAPNPDRPQTSAQVRQQKQIAASSVAQPQPNARPIVQQTQKKRVRESISNVMLKEQGQMAINDFIFSFIMKQTEGALASDPKQVAVIKNLSSKIDQVYKTTKNAQDIMGYIRVIAGIAYEVLEKKSEKIGKQVAGVGDNDLDAREKLEVNSIISKARNIKDPKAINAIKQAVDNIVKISK